MGKNKNKFDNKSIVQEMSDQDTTDKSEEDKQQPPPIFKRVTTTTTAMGYKNSNSLNKYIEPEIITLEEARKVVASLRARIRNQALQMITWRRALQIQEKKMTQMAREKGEELNSLARQLMLFESRLCKKQNEINKSIKERDVIINRQRRVIRRLQERLAEKKQVSQVFSSSSDIVIINNNNNNNDNDSAVVMDDNEDEEEDEAENDEEELTPSRFRSRICDVTLMRSISDAAQPSSYKGRKFNGIITNKVGVLETVYSIEEDEDQATEIIGQTNVPSITEVLIQEKEEEKQEELNETQSIDGRTTVAVNFDQSTFLEINNSDNNNDDDDGKMKELLEINSIEQQLLIKEEEEKVVSDNKMKSLSNCHLTNEPIEIKVDDDKEKEEEEEEKNKKLQMNNEGGEQRRRRNGICYLFEEETAMAAAAAATTNFDEIDKGEEEEEMINENNNDKKQQQQAQVTYNRVMSNHRSVTKPKDVKYKRINKAKSKSLEELRGRLRTWVDKGANITTAVVAVVDQSSYA